MADRTIKYVIGADTAQFENGARVVKRELGDVQRAGDGLQSSMSSLKSQLAGVFAGVSVVAFVKQTLEAALAVERLQSMFKATQGSVQAAARELEFIRGEAGRLGLVYRDAAEAYGKFMASIKGTSLEGTPGRKIFSGVSEAVAALKLDSQSASRIFLQMQQMASKGKVTAEDLNVMAESLPGVKQMIADAMGKTTVEVSKMMQDGKLLASDILPKLAEQLHRTYGQTAVEAATQGQAAINRFKNEIFETAAAIGEKLKPMMVTTLSSLTEMLQTWKTRPSGGFSNFLFDAASDPLLKKWGATQYTVGPLKDGNVDPQMARIEADRRAAEEIRNAARAKKEKDALAAMEKGSKEKDPMADLSRDYASMIGKMRREIIKNDPGYDALAEKIGLARDEFDKLGSRIPENQAALKQYLDTMQIELEQSIIDAQTLKEAVAETSKEFRLYLQDLESQPPASPYRNFLPDDEKQKILNDIREIKSATEDITIQAIDNPFDRELAQAKKYYAERNKLLQDSLKKELENAGYNEDQKKELIELTAKKTTALKEQQGVDEAEIERRKLKGMMSLNAQYLSYTGGLLNDLSSLIDGSSRDGFEAQKALAMGATVVNTASAIMQALASMPPPASYVAAAFAAATGAIQLAKIASTSYGGGGSVGGVSAGFSGGGSSAGGSVGGSIGAPITSIHDSQTQESLAQLAAAADNASLAIGKVADGMTRISDLFGEGSQGKLMAGGLTSAARETPRSLLGESIKSNVLLLGNPVDVLTNQLKNIFGGSNWYTTSTGLNLGLSGGGLGVRNYQQQQKDGGWFSGDKQRIDYLAADPQVQATLGSYMGSIVQTVLRSAAAIGTSANLGLANLPASNIQTSGRTAEDIQKDLESWFTKAADVIGQTVDGLKAFTFYGESAFDAVVRLSTSLQGVNEKLELVGATLVTASLKGANAAYKLADSMGGVDKFGEAVDDYFKVMFTETEQEALKAAQAGRQVTTAFSEMGLAAPTTKEAFRSIVDSLDLTTDSGAALFAAMMKIAPAFDTIVQSINKAWSTTVSATIDKQLDASKTQLDLAKSSASAFRQAAQSIADVMASLRQGDLSTLSPEQKYMAARLQFGQTANQALTGDQAALQALPTLAQNFATLSREYYASSSAYVSDYTTIMKALEAAGISAGTAATREDNRTILLENQVSLLEGIKTQIDKGTDASVAAITALTTALTINLQDLKEAAAGNASVLALNADANRAQLVTRTEAVVGAVTDGTGTGGVVQQALANIQGGGKGSLEELIQATTSSSDKLLKYYTAREVYQQSVDALNARSAWATTGSNLIFQGATTDQQYDVASFDNSWVPQNGVNWQVLNSPDGMINNADAVALLKMATGSMYYTLLMEKAKTDFAASLRAAGINLPTFAYGGITSGMSIAGEAGPEAIVPLPDGRRIPVQLFGGGDNREVLDRMDKMISKLSAMESRLAEIESKARLEAAA